MHSDHYKKSALVTGASRGIGRAIAVGLAEDGAETVGIHYATNHAAAERTAELVAAAGAKPVLIDAPLDGDGIAAARRDRRRVDGELDVLVNNAGINGNRRSARSTRDLPAGRRGQPTAPLFLIQEFAPRLRDGGRIVNISTGYTRVAARPIRSTPRRRPRWNNLGLALGAGLRATRDHGQRGHAGHRRHRHQRRLAAGQPRAGRRDLGVQPRGHRRGHRAGRPSSRQVSPVAGPPVRSSTRRAARALVNEFTCRYAHICPTRPSYT